MVDIFRRIKNSAWDILHEILSLYHDNLLSIPLFWNHWIKKTPSFNNMNFCFRNLRNVVDYHTFQIVYIPSHMRACSFLVGIVTGYLLYKMQKSGYKLSNTVTRLGWIGVVIIVFAIYIMAFTFYFPDVEKNYLYAAAYGSLHHLLWSGILSWGIVAVFVGSGCKFLFKN